jgi:hypothetical protein
MKFPRVKGKMSSNEINRILNSNDKKIAALLCRMHRVTLCGGMFQNAAAKCALFIQKRA